MDILALWVGRVVLAIGGLGLFVGLIWLAIYFITRAVNNGHQRAAETIAGKDYLDILRKAVADQEHA